VRNALILLVIVALVILAAGAFNHSVVFDIDYVAGTAASVSLLWVSAAVAAIVFVAGLAAAWFALSGAGGARRKLEAELQSTYERLRNTEEQADEARAAVKAAEARIAESRPSAPVEATVVDGREAATIVVPLAAEATMTESEAATVVADVEQESVAASEDETVVVADDAAGTTAAVDDVSETAAVADDAAGSADAATVADESVADITAPAKPAEAGPEQTAATRPAGDAATGEGEGPGTS
jgi:hypothetical protein